MLPEPILNQLRDIYPTRRYSAVLKILECVELLDETTVLIDHIETYLNNNIAINENSVFTDVDMIIYKYVIPEIVNKVIGLIVAIFNVDVYFLAGLLEFHINISKYNIGTTEEVFNILNTDELPAIGKFGDIINIYQQDFYPLDAYNAIEHVPNFILDRYKKEIEVTMRQIEVDPNQVTELYSLIAGVNPELLTSELLNYIIRYDAYDISERPALAHILNLVTENRISQEGLGVELAVFAIMFNKDYLDMSDTVALLYEEYDTAYLLDYIKKTLSSSIASNYEYN